MTITRDEATGTSDVAVPLATNQDSRPSRAAPVLLQIVAMVGIGALVYSNAADWFSTLNHDAVVSGYVTAVDALPVPERVAAIAAAEAYNSGLPRGLLRDPYTASPDASGHDDYESLLSVGDGVMGNLAYPALGISLPIYHGTSDETLAKGAGHLLGSSLPVGGPSTHAVLTSHSGQLHASLFSRLPEATIGDTFSLTIMGQTHHYRVDSMETVLPGETDGLQIVEGEDYVTLVTCTPIGVNTHRLMVRGVRIASPDENAGQAVIAGDGHTAGFPWWALWFGAGSAACAWLLFSPPRTRKIRSESHTGKEKQQ